jgi:hypothetical protein
VCYACICSWRLSRLERRLPGRTDTDAIQRMQIISVSPFSAVCWELPLFVCLYSAQSLHPCCPCVCPAVHPSVCILVLCALSICALSKIACDANSTTHPPVCLPKWYRATQPLRPVDAGLSDPSHHVQYLHVGVRAPASAVEAAGVARRARGTSGQLLCAGTHVHHGRGDGRQALGPPGGPGLLLLRRVGRSPQACGDDSTRQVLWGRAPSVSVNAVPAPPE